MRIGIDATSVLDELSGAEVHVFAVVEALRSYSEEEVVLFVRREIPVRWRDLPARFECVILPTARQEVATQVSLPLAARRARIDVLYCPAKPPPALAAVPIVAAIHDTVPWRLPKTMGRGAAAWYRTFHRVALWRGAEVATVSEAAASEIREHLKVRPARIHVVGNALGPWLATDEDIDASAPDPYLFSLCRIEPRKDLATVLDAWEVIHSQRPELRLLLGGKVGWKVSEVAERARETPGVELLGAVQNERLPSLYANATAFLTASRDEGFGLPVLEAMHFGTPVIASRIAAHVEVAGEAAVFFPVGDSSALAAAALSLLDDDAQIARLRGAGRIRAGHWSYERLASALSSALSAAAGRKSRR